MKTRAESLPSLLVPRGKGGAAAASLMAAAGEQDHKSEGQQERDESEKASGKTEAKPRHGARKGDFHRLALSFLYAMLCSACGFALLE